MVDRVHLNLIDSSRQLFELDPDTVVEEGPGWMFAAGSNAHPMIWNAAYRNEGALDAEELVARAKGFFAKRRRGFSVWVRGERSEDRDLLAAAEAAGFQFAYAMPEMVLRAPVEAPPLPAGAEIRKLTQVEQVDDYWEIAAASYTSIGFPPDVFASYSNRTGLLAKNVAAFLAYLDDEPVSIAMTIVSHDVAGIYWVGSLEQARGKGLGQATTAAATNAGFEMGANLASLQASPMGKPIYERMGYETIFDYRLYMSPPPSTPQAART